MEASIPMVSVSTGSMGSLRRKLATMKVDGKLKGARKAIDALKDELGSTAAQLQNFATTRPEPSAQAKQWMRQVREMVYDMEDWIDEYHHEDLEAPDKHGGGGIAGLVHRMRVGANDDIAKQIGVFTTRIKEANDRYKRYEDQPDSNSGNTDSAAGLVSSTVVVDHRLIALRAEETGLVGVKVPRDEIIRHLLRGDDKVENKVKVVSLVGSGGMGKTTLAQQVCCACVLQRRFKCRAFVCAGRNLPVKTVLKGILKQVNRQWQDGQSWDEQKLIHELREFLSSKKYLIVIDDVWSSSVWQVIRCALPENSLGSRIIMTTRVVDIAHSSCINQGDHVHHVEPLNRADAELLFCGRIFGPKGTLPSELKAISDNILKRCGGVPLAVIMVAGMLASKEKIESQWASIERSISSEGDVEVMKKILYHSYIELPHHLKSCLLYLSVFPEAYEIRKGCLIRRWIAEGFISSSIQEAWESCFNELISRSFIQPVPHDGDDSEAGCKVHDVIRDLIISLSAEENFVAVPAHSTSLMPHDRIRRLSLQYCYQGVAPTRPNDNIISYIRSLTIFGRDEEMPSPSKFRYLRVLDLEDSDKMAEQVANIENLFQLKYLGLGGKGMAKLPEQVGKLQHMETLDLRRSDVRELAATTLPSKLVHLLISDVKLPVGMQKMVELQELWTVNVSESSTATSVKELGLLKKLRVLGVKWCFSDRDSNAKAYRDNFVSALEKLAVLDKLRSLTLDTDEGSSLNFLVDSWSPNLNLTKFKLASTNYYFPKVPKKLASNASLPNLAYVEIGVTQVGKDELKILGGLPALTILKLRSREVSTKESFIISRNEFPLLQEFWFMRRDGGIKGVVFGNGAMLKLRKLRLQCNLQGAKSLADFKFGIKNLTCIKQVYVKIDYKDAEDAEVEAAEAAIRKAADVPSECELEFALKG